MISDDAGNSSGGPCLLLFVHVGHVPVVITLLVLGSYHRVLLGLMYNYDSYGVCVWGLVRYAQRCHLTYVNINARGARPDVHLGARTFYSGCTRIAQICYQIVWHFLGVYEGGGERIALPRTADTRR
jgi:hypothetical protein